MTAPASSSLITTKEEALEYFAARIAGARKVICYGTAVGLVFEREGTHFFSEDPGADPLNAAERIQRRVAGGRLELRRFNLDRARLMDHIVPAVERFTVSLPGTGRAGLEKRMLHGPALADGRYLRVVLRPGPGEAWTAVTAYPISLAQWREAVRSKRAKFPP